MPFEESGSVTCSARLEAVLCGCPVGGWIVEGREVVLATDDRALSAETSPGFQADMDILARNFTREST